MSTQASTIVQRDRVQLPFSANQGGQVVSPFQLVRPTCGTLIVVIGILIPMYIAGVLDHSQTLPHVFNIIGPSVVFLAMTWAGWATIRRFPVAVWTTYFWFLANGALFFGLGPLVHVFGNSATLARVSSSPYALNAPELLQTNLLTAVGMFVALLCIYLTTRGMPNDMLRRTISMRKQSYLSLPVLATTLIMVGTVTRYGLILPYKFGMLNYTLSGIVMSTRDFFDLGLALVASLAVRKRGIWLALLWGLLPLHLLSCVLEFAKQPVVIALLMVGLGGYIADRKMVRFATWVALALASLIVLQPFVRHARSRLMRDTGTMYRATLTERFAVAKEYWTGSAPTPLQTRKTEDTQEGWLRLSYSGVQAEAIRQYDRGQPGETLTRGWIVFVPRVVWPEKPIVQPGRIFCERVTGRGASFVSVTIYGDGYWQFGWPGAVLLSGLMGIFLAFYCRWSLILIQAENLLMLPVVVIGMHTGMYSPCKYFINGIIAAIPTIALYAMGATLFTTAIRKRGTSPRDFERRSRTSQSTQATDLSPEL